MPPLFAALAVDGYGEGSVMFNFALTITITITIRIYIYIYIYVYYSRILIGGDDGTVLVGNY